MKTRDIRFIFSIAAALVLLVIVVMAVMRGDLLLQADLQHIRDFTEDNLALSMLVMLLIMTVQNLFTVIPLILVVSINISLFDPVYGFLWSWATSLAAATVAFYTVRLWFQQTVNARLNRKWVDKIEKSGFLYVLAGRLIPVMPSSLINIAAGVSSVKYTHFIVSTAIGNMLYFFMLSLVINGLIPNILDLGGYAIVVIAVVGFAVVAVVKRRKQKKPSK